MGKKNTPNEFQYNYCFGGTLLKKIHRERIIMFQYNYCFGGTRNEDDEIASVVAFQYNYCFGGTIVSN